MSVGPAPVLSLLLGILHVSIYVLIRGSSGQRLPWLVLAAFLGSWAGDAIGSRFGIDVLLVGDFHLITASVMAWVGILGVAIVAILGPQPKQESDAHRPATTSVTRIRGQRGLDRREPAAVDPGTDPDDSFDDPDTEARG